MDSCNQAMWRAAGLKGGEAMDSSFIQHPYYPGTYLFFSPDTPHLIKAMKTALCNHSFQLPASAVQKNFLPSNMVGHTVHSRRESFLCFGPPRREDIFEF